jgi:hypothetical protein
MLAAAGTSEGSIQTPSLSGIICRPSQPKTGWHLVECPFDKLAWLAVGTTAVSQDWLTANISWDFLRKSMWISWGSSDGFISTELVMSSLGTRLPPAHAKSEQPYISGIRHSSKGKDRAKLDKCEAFHPKKRG